MAPKDKAKAQKKVKKSAEQAVAKEQITPSGASQTPDASKRSLLNVGGLFRKKNADNVLLPIDPVDDDVAAVRAEVEGRDSSLHPGAYGSQAKVSSIEDLPVMVKGSPQRVYDAYIMNLSGTLFKGDLLMPGVDKVFTSLSLMRRPMYFMSSNSHTSPLDYQKMLAGYGLDVDMDYIFTPVRVVVEYLQKYFADANVYVIGDDNFYAHMRDAGISLTDDPDKIDVVIVAHDRDFSFAKLDIAYRAITGPRRAKLVSTSMVRNWPTADGGTEPGTRGIVRAIESATKTRMLRNLGTPESGFLDCIFQHLDVAARQVLVVSDSLTTDIRMAHNYGVPTALVLTGEASLAEAQNAKRKDKPNFVLDSVADMVPQYILGQL